MKPNIVPLICHDLAVAFKNKTFILLLCVPLFVYGLMTFVDSKDAPTTAIRLGLVEAGSIDPTLVAAIRSVPDLFALRMVKTADEGALLLNDRKIDGMLNVVNGTQVSLTVLQKDSPSAAIITRAFLSLQIASTGGGPPWIAEIAAIQSASAEGRILPTWILMVVLLIAFFVLPAQVAEEKEKQWLSGLLQTPMTEAEWIAAKLIFAAILTTVTVLALQLLGGQFFLPWTYYLTLLLGGFCFSATGLALGMLCRNQAAARTFGIIFYLPLLIPAALSDVSTQFRMLARWTPSFALYEPVQTILMNKAGGELFPQSWLFMLVLGSAACVLSARLMRIRWLMH